MDNYFKLVIRDRLQTGRAHIEIVAFDDNSFAQIDAARTAAQSMAAVYRDQGLVVRCSVWRRYATCPYPAIGDYAPERTPTPKCRPCRHCGKETRGAKGDDGVVRCTRCGNALRDRLA